MEIPQSNAFPVYDYFNFSPNFWLLLQKKKSTNIFVHTSLLEEPILTFLEVGSKEYIIRKTKLRFVKNVIDASALSSL